jgi:predicted DNA-binding helix-hairpin-helix protein
VDLNRAPREMLLRVPGLGVASVDRLVAARRVRQLRRADVERLRAASKRVLAFVHLPDHRPGPDAQALAAKAPRPMPSSATTAQSSAQASLFDDFVMPATPGTSATSPLQVSTW